MDPHSRTQIMSGLEVLNFTICSKFCLRLENFEIFFGKITPFVKKTEQIFKIFKKHPLLAMLSTSGMFPK